MSKKEDYEPIPDVDLETGSTFTEDHDSSEELAKKYPEANHLERQFLSKLDHAINNAKPKVVLPKMKAADVGPPRSITDFIASIKYPTVALVVTVASAVSVAFMDSPIVIALFPYYSCILTFMSSIPATKGELDCKANAFFSKVEGNKKQAEKKLEGIAEIGLRYIDTARHSMETAIKPIKKTLDAATELETMLRKVDPTIDIPDTSDIEKAFNGISDKITVIPAMCKKAVDVSRNIPRPLQSKENFDILIIYPALAVFLALQLIGVWQTQHPFQSEMATVVTTSESALSTSSTLSTSVVGDVVGGDEYVATLENEDIVESVAGVESDTESMLIYNAISSYIAVMIQIVITFVMAHVSVVVSQVNGIVEKVENSLNKSLDEKADPIFKMVFEEGFGEIKTKMLELIHEVEKIEGPMEKAKSMKEKLERMQNLDAANLVPDSLQGAIPGGFAKEKMEEIKMPDVPDLSTGIVTKVPKLSTPGKFKKFGKK